MIRLLHVDDFSFLGKLLWRNKPLSWEKVFVPHCWTEIRCRLPLPVWQRCLAETSEVNMCSCVSENIFNVFKGSWFIYWLLVWGNFTNWLLKTETGNSFPLFRSILNSNLVWIVKIWYFNCEYSMNQLILYNHAVQGTEVWTEGHNLFSAGHSTTNWWQVYTGGCNCCCCHVGYQIDLYFFPQCGFCPWFCPFPRVAPCLIVEH